MKNYHFTLGQTRDPRQGVCQYCNKFIASMLKRHEASCHLNKDDLWTVTLNVPVGVMRNNVNMKKKLSSARVG